MDFEATGVCDYLDGGFPVLFHLQGLRRGRENGVNYVFPVNHVYGVVLCILVGVK